MKPDAAASNSLGFPEARLLSKEQAAAYLGIGVTLLEQLGVPQVRFGRRCVYDRIDLDRWLDEYKRRGRAGRDGELNWPVRKDSTGEPIPGTGGSRLSYRTADAYAKALGLKTERKQKRSSPD
jgi:hypothetical protein